MTKEKELTGYPSIDKPWMKFYDDIAVELPNGTMYDYLKECTKNRTTSIAFDYFGRKLKYSWMYDEIERIAGRLSEEGIKTGDIVMLVSLNTPEAMCLFYAINKIGAISCNEYVSQSAELLSSTITKVKPAKIFILDVFVKEYEDVVEKNKNKVVVLQTTSSMPVGLRMIVGRKITMDERYTYYSQWIKGEIKTDYEISHDGNAPAMMLSTSGTTGIPKKVVHTSCAINAVVYQYQKSGIEFEAGKNCISPAPIFLTFGVTLGMHLPLCTGITSVIVLNPQNDKVVKAFIKKKPEYFLGGVHMVREMLLDKKMQKIDLSFLKVFAIGGESFSEKENKQVNEFLKNRGSQVPMITGYGMTEMGATAVTEMNNATRCGTVGIPQLAISTKIIDSEKGEELEYNKIGEILLSGPSVFQEYYNNEEETKTTIEIDENGVRWVHTGDLGKIDSDGFVYVNGRIKRIYLRQLQDGNIYKVFPDYIEHLVETSGEIKACAVICVEHDMEISVPVVFAVFKNQDIGLKNRISDMIVEQSSEYNKPFKIISLEDIPTLPNGKTDYQKLEKVYFEEIE